MSSFSETFTKNEEKTGNLEYDDAAFYYFFICFLTFLILPLAYKIMKKIIFNANTIKSFDPYDLLGIDPSATEAQIKQAYRQMTVKYHPDKNKDDPQATAKFIIMTKAYECLTDPKVRAIYQKYGNPDGPGRFNIAIALPSFLLKKQNNVLVLAIFFLLFIIILPGAVIYWYTQFYCKYDSNGLLLENKEYYLSLLNENFILRQCPILISLSKEFDIENMPLKNENEKEYILETWEKIKPHLAKLPTYKIKGVEIYSKALILLSAYLFKIKIPIFLHNDLAYILKLAPALLQGLWANNHYLEQLHFFSKEDAITQFLKKAKQLPTFDQLIKSSTSEQIQHFSFLPQDDQKIILNELSCFPNIQVTYKVEVDGEEKMQQNEIVTISIELFRLDLTDAGSQTKCVHSPRYPFQKQEQYFLLIGNKERNIIIFAKLIKETQPHTTQQFFFHAVVPGIFNWTLFIRHDSYKGLDLEFPIQFTILPANTIKREYYVHPEDEECYNQLTFMESLMKTVNGDSEEEYEEDNDW